MLFSPPLIGAHCAGRTTEPCAPFRQLNKRGHVQRAKHNGGTAGQKSAQRQLLIDYARPDPKHLDSYGGSWTLINPPSKHRGKDPLHGKLLIDYARPHPKHLDSYPPRPPSPGVWGHMASHRYPRISGGFKSPHMKSGGTFEDLKSQVEHLRT